MTLNVCLGALFCAIQTVDNHSSR